MYSSIWVDTSLFRLKKVLTLISICVSKCEILGFRANSIQSRNCDLCDHNFWLSLSSFDSTLVSEVWKSPRGWISSRDPDSTKFGVHLSKKLVTFQHQATLTNADANAKSWSIITPYLGKRIAVCQMIVSFEQKQNYFSRMKRAILFCFRSPKVKGCRCSPRRSTRRQKRRTHVVQVGVRQKLFTNFIFLQETS